ncbi:hypothetical protein QKU48_gp1337 [Fadolivirus algeromassiliense]|jgi:hypothetical protein|uniref:Uncharacterized protein n=1 Tax=Fadolivirus FV1/VV64 TaxID=3070911 RepID=A0A7D3V634_9VIRU|nr:hypothetical protein QKU48_gp1337 [Fadolivirus algeromassiliense]QKF94795.1 hypothetical protein Fadolivirus_1_1337 [Fadolivirus FV1/VV64]
MSHRKNIRNLTKSQLGNIGEDCPPNEFSNIKNLNMKYHNFPIFDLIAQKNGEYYVFSAKARHRYDKQNKINPFYNLLTGKTLSKKFRKALDLLKNMGYDIDTLHYCFLIVPIEENKDCVYYWDEFTSLKPECTHMEILNKGITLRVYVSDKHLATYKKFGVHEWQYIKDKYLKDS